jgi:hypothetical protein
MYDGNHSNESHYNALLHYYLCLDDTFVFIVDDWNWENSVTQLSETWWNGMFCCHFTKKIKSL